MKIALCAENGCAVLSLLHATCEHARKYFLFFLLYIHKLLQVSKKNFTSTCEGYDKDHVWQKLLSLVKDSSKKRLP